MSNVNAEAQTARSARRVVNAFAMLCGCISLLVGTTSGTHAQGMAAQGSFAVSESGAATYTVPITIPPGIAGMEPKLSLAYNSQGGNGLLGMGWSLQGLSAITRCPQTMAQDSRRGGVNYDADDRFCLDGQRLVLVSASGAYGAGNSEYRIERDGFAQIKASTATINYDRCPFYTSPGCGTSYGVMPQNFTVKTKAGLTMEYGATNDSRILAQGKATPIVWALNRVTDTKGNYYKVKYCSLATAADSDCGAANVPSGSGLAAGSEWFPIRIEYTGNGAQSPANSVLFVYQARPATEVKYRAGSSAVLTVRLKHLQTFVGPTLTKVQTLDYQSSSATGRSILKGVQDCISAAATVCSTAVSFAATTVASPSLAHQGTWTGSFAGWPNNGYYPRMLADVDGDGRADVVGFACDGVYVGRSTGTAFTVQQWTPGFGCSGWGTMEYYPRMLADVNGDGKSDLIGFACDGVYVGLSTGTSFSVARWTTNFSCGGWGSTNNHPRMVADVNGDGRADLVGFACDGVYVGLSTGTSSTGFTVSKWTSAFGCGSGWTDNSTYPRMMADVNGDGFADIVGIGSQGVYVALSDGVSSFGPAVLWTAAFGGNSGWAGMDAYPRLMVDVNGDGLADIVGFACDGVYVGLSTGTGFNVSRWNTSYGCSSGWASMRTNPRYLVDVNGDGLPDVVGFADTGVFVALAGSQSFATMTQWTTAFAAWNAYDYITLVGDVNGDGKADVVGFASYGVDVATSAGVMPDLTNSIASGIGGSTSLTFNALSSGSAYTKDAGASAATYPQLDLQMPLYVVSKVDRSHGLGGSGSAAVASTSYRYGGLKASYDGRGMLGFRWVEAKDESTGVRARTEYRQDFPYTGLVDKGCRTTASVVDAADCTAIMTSTGKLGHSSNSYGYIEALGSGTYNIGSGTTATQACPLTTPTVTAGKRFFPYSCQGVEQGWDLNAAVLPTVTTKTEYDAWGNAAKISVYGVHPTDTADKHCKTTENTYLGADTSNWILGRLSRAKVKSTTGTDANVCPTP